MNSVDPSFSPDGSRIAYVEGRGDRNNTLRVMNPEGGGARVLLQGGIMNRAFYGPLEWSPDGTSLMFGMDFGPHHTYIVASDAGASACTNAYNYIHNTGSGTWATSGLTNIVVQISATCPFSNGNNDTNTIRGNLA